MTRRYWKAEEKLAIINEIRGRGQVQDTEIMGRGYINKTVNFEG